MSSTPYSSETTSEIRDFVPHPEISARFGDLHTPLTAQAAMVESNRCLYCFDAPCMVACPTHIDVPGFIKRIAKREPARLGKKDFGRQRVGRKLFARLPG